MTTDFHSQIGTTSPKRVRVRPRRVTSASCCRPGGGATSNAREKLMPLVYSELRRRAAAYLRRERTDHTLQPTALVNEAYLRLVGQQGVVWQNRAHFCGIAAQMMRRILVDHARGRGRGKRLGAGVRVTLNERVGKADPPDCELLLLDQALHELSSIDPQQAQIVELRYFGGLTESEVADVLTVSRSTVTREWTIAKGWLYRRMTSGPGTESSMMDAPSWHRVKEVIESVLATPPANARHRFYTGAVTMLRCERRSNHSLPLSSRRAVSSSGPRLHRPPFRHPRGLGSRPRAAGTGSRAALSVPMQSSSSSALGVWGKSTGHVTPTSIVTSR